MIVSGSCVSEFAKEPVSRIRVKFFDPWPIDLYDMVSV